YKPKFRPMYLIGGLFSFIVLLNSGFSHYYDELYLYQSTFSISIFCLVIYGYIFLTTYFGELSSVSTSFSLIAMLVVIGFSYFPIISFENCNCIVFTSLFITLGPLLLHTIRITGSMFILFKRIRKLNKEYSSKLDKQINSIDTVLEAQSEIERLQALIDSFKKH
ncbi:MAG: hypothetical protein WAT16_02930, partial [Saprospiraceae bacterium]